MIKNIPLVIFYLILSVFRSKSSSITLKGNWLINWLINYPKSFKTTHSWKSCKMTCKTVSFSEMPLDMERYCQIFSNIIQYCQILPDIAWFFQYYQILSFGVKFCFNLSDILKNVNKCSIFGILTSQYSQSIVEYCHLLSEDA